MRTVVQWPASMKNWRRWLWPLCKTLLAVAILFFVGRQFYHDLDRLTWESFSVQPAWLVLSGMLYIAGLCFSAWFWQRLLYAVGERPRPVAIVRAYFIGHLGKYVPGKGWALLLRGTLIRGHEARLGPAILTAAYEVLTTMASGALVAALIFLILPPEIPDLEWNPFFTGLLL